MGDVKVAREGRVLVLALDAPGQGNALDPPLLTALEARLREAASGDARAVLLRGEGERAFSTGYNVGELARELAQGPSVQDEANHPLERALRALEECPVPTLALVHGHAYGAGCELAATCDLRLAADDARFCMPPEKLGILYSASGLRRFLELLGPQATCELFFTGEPIDAARALALGLVARVHPKAQATGAALALAGAIAANAPLALKHTKTVIKRYLRPPLPGPEALAEIGRLRQECFQSKDFRDAARAFLEKRPPPPFEGV